MNIQSRTLYWGKVLGLYFPFIILFATLRTKNGHGGDLFCWAEWAKYSFNNGLENVYKSWTDYLPLYHYILFLYAKIQGSEDKISQNIYQLKYFTFIFDFASTLLIFKIIENKYQSFYKSFLYSLLFLFNIGVMYNTVIWGQIDGILSFLIALSIFSAYKKNLFISLLSIVLALNLKLQAIIFVPLFLALILPLINKKNFKINIIYIAGIIFIQILILLPFILSGDLSKVWKVVANSSNKYPFVSMNAYNLWYWFFNGNLMQINDSGTFLFITYKLWGNLLFFTLSGLLLFPFIKGSLLYIFKNIEPKYTIKQILIISTIIPLFFFFFNTEMHERYSHPALIFLSIYSLLYDRIILLFIGSLAYYLNMESVLQYTQSSYYNTIIFRPDFVSLLFGTLILILILDLFDYRISLKKNNIQA